MEALVGGLAIGFTLLFLAGVVGILVSSKTDHPLVICTQCSSGFSSWEKAVAHAKLAHDFDSAKEEANEH